MTLFQADLLEYYLKSVSGVRSVQVFDRTGDAIVVYTGERSDIIRAFSSFSYEKAQALDLVPEHTPALNREFEDKLVVSVMNRAFTVVPAPARPVGAGGVEGHSLCGRRAESPVPQEAVRVRAGCHRRHRISGPGRL